MFTTKSRREPAYSTTTVEAPVRAWLAAGAARAKAWGGAILTRLRELVVGSGTRTTAAATLQRERSAAAASVHPAVAAWQTHRHRQAAQAAAARTPAGSVHYRHRVAAQGQRAQAKPSAQLLNESPRITHGGDTRLTHNGGTRVVHLP